MVSRSLERGVTHPYRDTAQRLAAALQLLPADEEPFRAAVQPVRRHGTVRAHTQSALRQENLPIFLTSFIGREQQVGEVTALLDGARLVTLTGVGGCGKTRLALEVARVVVPTYPDGVWLVELGRLSDPTLVAQEVGAVFAVRESPDQPLTIALKRAVGGHRVLLVLDNCEHLIEACAELLNALLRGCPQLRVLATSRESVGIDGEVAWRVPSLTVPDAERAASVADLESNPAVQLFVERARTVRPRFGLTERNAQAVAQICRRLAGIPLALELAAARIHALTAEQLALRLDQRFRLLTGGSRAALPRQQTLLAALDWSYALLSKSERLLFERLAVFAHAWTLEAAEAVGHGTGVAADDVLDLLAGQVRKSLVVTGDATDGAERYALLETVRDYARQKLLARGVNETSATRQRHAGHYSDLAEQLYSVTRVRSVFEGGAPGAAELRARIEEVRDDLRTALAWWLEASHPARGLRLAVTLCEYWMWCGTYAEARRWLERMLDLASRTVSGTDGTENQASSVSVKVRALIGLGVLASWHGEDAQSCAFLQDAVALARQLNDGTIQSFALAVLGLSLWLAGDPERSAIVLDECLRVSIESGSEDSIFQAYRHMGIVARWQGEYERSSQLLEQSVTVARQQIPPGSYSYAHSLSNLARGAYLRGN